MLGPIISKIPIKISVPLLLTAPVIVAVVVLSVIAFGQAQSTANDLMEQSLAQIHDRIEERLKDLLNHPYRIQRINADLIIQNLLQLKKLGAWQQMLFEQVQTFKGISSISWAGADGRSVGIGRYPGESGYLFSIKDNPAEGNILEYYVDSQGRIELAPRKQTPFDPREQSWYAAAIKAGKPTWTNPYARMYDGEMRATLAMGYVQPFFDQKKQVMGVMNAELTMDDITLFLEKVSVGRTGKAFIIDNSGRLMATSTGVPLIDSGNFPVIASVSADRDIAAAAAYVEKTIGSFQDVNARYQFSLDINKKPHLLMVAPSNHETGLSWIIATLVPESDFLAEIQAGREKSIKIGIIAVFSTLLLGIVLAAISLWPMLDLARYVRKVGQGDLEQDLKLEYSTEFVKLSKQINAMTAGLRDRMRLRHSLALAQEVQQNLLPSGTPEIEGLDIAGHATYCDETGGDYFDFLDVKGSPETTAVIAVGDVAEDTGGEGFMTMLLMTVDARRKEMRWATAGHEVPVIYDPQRDEFIELKSYGMALGIKKNNTYHEETFTDVKSGQIYLALTDGLWETFNKDGEMFGMERVQEMIRRYSHLSGEKISEKIIEEMIRFRGKVRPEDDLTFVVVKVL
jgi:hypothetical protein